MNSYLTEEEPKDASVVEAKNEDVKGRLFTNDANTNNNIASGLLGIGLGVGGVLLTQHILEQQKQKERCYCPPPPTGPYYRRYKRDDGVMGRLFGIGESNRYPKPCPPCPVYPNHRPQGPYHPPPVHPPYPVNQGYAPAYPQQNYPAPQPHRPQYPQHHKPQYPQQHRPQYPQYPRENPKPNYSQPNHYTPAPAPQYPNYPSNSGYAPSFQGRSLPTEDVVEDTKAKNEDVGALLNGGAVRFGDK